MTDHVENTSKSTDGRLSQNRKSHLFWIRLLPIVVIAAPLVCLIYPAIDPAAQARHRTRCKHNLNQIALAILSYQSEQGALPPAHTIDADGKPLHSWRALILPYLGETALYQSIDLAKPWNDPANATACNAEPACFRCPSTVFPTANYTTYLAVVATNGCFLPDSSRHLSDITDKHATLMLIEAAPKDAVHWMSPMDADDSLIMNFGPDAKRPHPGGTNIALVDGTARFISDRSDKAELRKLITIDGKDGF